MLYDYRCGVISMPNHFITSTEMRFFWLPLLIMNCNGKPFTHIYEWKRCAPSSRSLGSFFSILVVAIVVLCFVSMICFRLSFLLLGSDSESKYASDSKAFNSATNDCLAWHSMVLWVGLLWNSHHFPMSFFDFVVVLFSCRFNELS